MMRPHPLLRILDNMFTGRSARQVSTMNLPQACFEHSNFFKVTAPEERPGQLRPGAHRRAVGTSRPVLTVRRTGRPTPRSNYELFNCNNLNIRYWSWNYRGCWHQTCPPMDPR
ncbi:hypothetical protein V6N13_056630 [Hibiscus sabdariffa]